MIIKKYMSGNIVQTYNSETGECIDIEWIPDFNDCEYTDEWEKEILPYFSSKEDTISISPEEYEKLKNLWCSFDLTNIN